MAIFSSILHRAQAGFDTAIDHVINRVIIAVPFLLSGAFGLAAAAYWLNERFGAIQANLILAGVCAVFGLLASIALRTRLTAASDAATTEDKVPDALKTSTTDDVSAADRELMLSALSTAAPIALPALLRAVIRNLPIILAVLAAIFVMAQPTMETGGQDAAEKAAN